MKRITEEEYEIFSKNYQYMWEILNVTYYDVSINKDFAPSHLKMLDVLPSYTVLWQLQEKRDKLPTMNTINKIATFFDANVEQTITSHDLLNTDLKTENMIYPSKKSHYKHRFDGKYYGYYYSTLQRNRLSGAVMKIYVVDNVIQVRLFTGMSSDEIMFGEAVAKMFDKDGDITKKDFFELYKTLPEEHKRNCVYYEGTAELTSNALNIICQSRDKVDRRLFLTFDVGAFLVENAHNYHGGMAFAISTADGITNSVFYQMAFISAAEHHVPYSIHDEQLRPILLLPPSSDRHIDLTRTKDNDPYLLFLKSGTPQP